MTDHWDHHYIEDPTFLLVHFNGESVKFSTHISSDMDDDEVNEVICAWADGGESCIHHKFTIPHCVEMAFNAHYYPPTGEVDIEHKPVFDALRRDLREAIAMIDAIKFNETKR